jgi:hypothetical protein
MLHLQVLKVLRDWYNVVAFFRSRTAAVMRGRRRVVAMQLSTHFSVWAVCTSASVMEERERENFKFQAVYPFVRLRKLEHLWSIWRDYFQQQRRMYAVAGAIRMATQSRAIISYLA